MWESGPDMDEIIALDKGSSFGFLTRARGRRRAQAVVLFNAGLIHRIGPFRLHVQLARRLAEQGFDVFRFDMPRHGDASAGNHDTKASMIDEALNAVQAATGVHGFVVGGICSAADLGWRTALADHRVQGLLLLDSMAVQNRWFRWGQLRLVLNRSPLRWPGMALRFLKTEPQDAPGLQDYRDWPEPAQFIEQAGQMLERGVRILALYTGGVSYYLLHSRQLDATFGRFRRHRGLDVEFWPKVDHLIFSTVDREAVMERIERWAAAL